MLDVALDPYVPVVQVRLSGRLTTEMLTQVQRFVAAFFARHGETASIFDYSGITGVDAPTGLFTTLGRQPPLTAQATRVYVCPSAEIYGLARLFATHQELHGFKPPRIVRALADAHLYYGTDAGRFESLPLEAYLGWGSGSSPGQIA